MLLFGVSSLNVTCLCGRPAGCCSPDDFPSVSVSTLMLRKALKDNTGHLTECDGCDRPRPHLFFSLLLLAVSRGGHTPEN